MAENDGATADAGNTTENTANPAPNSAAAERAEAAKTFTQDDVNRVVAERLARERAKYSDHDELAERAKRAEAAEAAAAEAQARAEAAEAAAARGEVAATRGIPVALLNGPEASTPEALAAYADALDEWRNSVSIPRPNSSALGSVSGAPASGSAASTFADFFRSNLS